MDWTHDYRLSLLRTSCQVSFGNASSFRNKTCSCEPMLSKESKFTSNVAEIPRVCCLHFVTRFRCLQGLQTSKTMIAYTLLGTYLPQTSGFSNVDFWGLGTNVKSNMVCPRTQTVLEWSKQPRKAATGNKISPRKTNKWWIHNTQPLLGNALDFVNARIFTLLFSSPRAYFVPKSRFLQNRSTNKKKIGENKNAKFCRWKYLKRSTFPSVKSVNPSYLRQY